MLLFGSEDSGNVIGWIGGLAALATALGSAIVVIWNTIHKNRQERDASAIAQLEKFADRLQEQLEQQKVHIKEQGDAILQMHEEHSTCQIELSDVYGNLERFCDFCERLTSVCKSQGLDPGTPPKKLERKPRPDRTAMEFRMRSLRQRTETLNEQSHTIQESTPPKTNGNGT